MVFVDGETAERGVEAASTAGARTVIGGNTEHDSVMKYDEWLAAQSSDPADETVPPRPNLLCTSGTSGQPKGVELPPTMFAGGASVAEHLSLLQQNPTAQFGTHLVVGPMYHTAPLAGARLLAAGVPLVILGRFDAEATLRAIERFEIGSTTMVPTHFIRLLDLPATVRSRYDTSRLQWVSRTGSKCPVETKRAMIEWWGPILAEVYGSTEAGVMCRILSDEWLAYPGSVGKAMPPFEAIVYDDAGEPVDPNVEGRLYFKDPSGRGIVYHSDPEKSAEAHIAPGIFTLGEIGYVNEAGYVYITDRFSDIIVSGGVNIYRAEAEHVLVQHPDIDDVACIGIADSEMGQSLKALVVPTDIDTRIDPQSLLEWCRARLTHYKFPKSLEFVDGLDRNEMGKVNTRKLRDRFPD